MSVQPIIMVSQSADASATPLGSLVSCLAIVVLDINDNPIAEFRNKYSEWAESAQRFATKYGYGPEFRAVSKRVKAGSDLFGDDDDVTDLGKLIYRNRKAVYADTSISRDMYKLMVMCARCLYKDDDTAWKYIEKHVSILRDARLTSIFLSDEDEPIEIDGMNASSASNEMKSVYKKLTGDVPKFGYALNPTLIKGYREDNPKLWDEYSRLNKLLNKETKRLVFRFVRNSGKERVPVDAVSKFLDKQGLLHNLPRGFEGGLIDENMEYYTAAGNKLDKAPVGLVRMNPKYDPKSDNTYVLYALVYGKNEKGGDASAGRIRTVSMNQANREKRHAVALDFIDNEKRVRSKWLADLKRKHSKEQILAALVELLWATSARVGGKGNATKGEPTYGLTTLRKSHMKIKNNELYFEYTGKKLSDQSATYNIATPEGRLVGQIVAKLLEQADDGEPVFQFRGKPIIRHAIAKYLKTLGTDMSPHSFRRVTGSKMAMDIIAKNPFSGRKKPVTEREVNAWLKKQMKEVGRVLGHRNGENVSEMVALKSYIAPQIIAQFYDSLSLRPPNFIPSANEAEKG